MGLNHMPGGRFYDTYQHTHRAEHLRFRPTEPCWLWEMPSLKKSSHPLRIQQKPNESERKRGGDCHPPPHPPLHHLRFILLFTLYRVTGAGQECGEAERKAVTMA